MRGTTGLRGRRQCVRRIWDMLPRLPRRWVNTSRMLYLLQLRSGYIASESDSTCSEIALPAMCDCRASLAAVRPRDGKLAVPRQKLLLESCWKAVVTQIHIRKPLKEKTTLFLTKKNYGQIKVVCRYCWKGCWRLYELVGATAIYMTFFLTFALYLTGMRPNL